LASKSLKIFLLSIIILTGCTSREETMNAVNDDSFLSGYSRAGSEYSGLNDAISDVHYGKGLGCGYCHPAPIADSMLFRGGHSPEDKDVTEACRSCHAGAAEKNDNHHEHWSAYSSSGTEIPCRVCHVQDAPRPDSFPIVRIKHKVIRPTWNLESPLRPRYCSDCH